jgi:subtilisin family serine protease
MSVKPLSIKPMSDKPTSGTLGSAQRGAPHLPSRQSVSRWRGRSVLVAIAAGAITLSAVVESYAQRGGFGMGRGGMNVPGTSTRYPGGDGPRYPGGGGGPRFPGGGGGVIMIPGGYGPVGRGPVVDYEDDDEGPARRRTKRLEKKHKQPTKQKQIANRSGFNPPPPGEQRFVQNEVLLNVASGTSAPAVDAIARRHRLTRLDLQSFEMTQRSLARLRIDDGRPVAAVIRSLQADARILGAQPNYLYALQQGAASPSAVETQYSLVKMQLRQAHAIATGGGVLVAVVDSMIDAGHPDLQGVVAAAFDATGTADKPHHHGTGIAGVIAAHGKLTGAAPAVKILAVRAFPASGADGNSMNILKGLNWSGKQNANIINMSFTGAPDDEVHIMLKSLRQHGAVLIAAAGNAGPQSRPLYPAAFPEVIAVTATDVDDKLFKMANRGTHIAVAAPGVDVLAAAPNSGYQITTGTSFAAAQVSGVAALILDRNRKLDAAAVRRILMSTARDLGPVGHDDQFGSGLVDALGAVMQAAPASSDVSGSAPAAAN